MNAPLRVPYDSARTQCLAQLDLRFGWLVRELAMHLGNVSSLKDHEQVLWYGRQKVVNRFNRIGLIRDKLARDRAYKRLEKSLER